MKSNCITEHHHKCHTKHVLYDHVITSEPLTMEKESCHIGKHTKVPPEEVESVLGGLDKKASDIFKEVLCCIQHRPAKEEDL